MATAILPAGQGLVDEIVTGWLTDPSQDNWDSPSGPLYLGGRYAVQEATMTGGGRTNCCLCTGSSTVECC